MVLGAIVSSLIWGCCNYNQCRHTLAGQTCQRRVSPPRPGLRQSEESVTTLWLPRAGELWGQVPAPQLLTRNQEPQLEVTSTGAVAKCHGGGQCRRLTLRLGLPSILGVYLWERLSGCGSYGFVKLELLMAAWGSGDGTTSFSEG